MTVQLKKGRLVLLEDNFAVAELMFQFNPTTIRRVVGVEWEYLQGAGRRTPIASYVKTKPERLHFELLLSWDLYKLPFRPADIPGHVTSAAHFDTFGNVAAQQAFLDRFTQPQGDAYDDSLFRSPPLGELILGNRGWFVTFDKIDYEDLQFNKKLDPTRSLARVSATGIFYSRAEEKFVHEFRVALSKSTPYAKVK